MYLVYANGNHCSQEPQLCYVLAIIAQSSGPLPAFAWVIAAKASSCNIDRVVLVGDTRRERH